MRLLLSPVGIFLVVALCVMGMGSSSHPYSDFDCCKDPVPSEEVWVDSVLQSMTVKERIGQLFMLRAHSNWSKDDLTYLENTIKEYNIGGLCFFQGNVKDQAVLTNRYQAASRIPLMISFDAEWGLAMRLKGETPQYPYQITLGAIQDNDLLIEMGKKIGEECRSLGIHVNFAPVVDVNNNPNNPVINYRSFGEDRYNVGAKGVAYARGLGEAGVLACAKHFPGHGDTDVDSHLDLPVIKHDRKRLDSIEMFPFQMLADNQVPSMMVAHLHIPAIDDRTNVSTTLSRKAVTDILRHQMGFKGLIFTDALDMQGVAKYHSAGKTSVEAFKAGNDVLLLPDNTKMAVTAMYEALEKGEIQQSDIDDSVRRILRAKYRLGLTFTPTVNVTSLEKDLKTDLKAQALKQRLYEAALTLLKNDKNQVPLAGFVPDSTLVFSIGATGTTAFQEAFLKFGDVQTITLPKQISSAATASMLKLAKNKKHVIVGFHSLSQSAKSNYALDVSGVAFVEALQKAGINPVVVVFGNPYAMKNFTACETLLAGYENDPLMQQAAAQGIVGVFSISGKLPVSAGKAFPYYMGLNTSPLQRLGYSLPEQVGMSSTVLSQIDTLVKEAIRNAATPGAVVLVAKDGRIVYEKAFGTHTYTKGSTPTKVDDIFDLASVTKIAATTLCIMDLHSKGMVDLDLPLHQYLPEALETNKQDITLREIMAHHAGLIAWIPFYEKTVAKTSTGVTLPDSLYKNTLSGDFTVPVNQGLFMNKTYVDSIWSYIYQSDTKDKRYKYSDLGFYLAAEVIKEVTGKTVDVYAKEMFYDPMGLTSTGYNPWKRFSLDRMLPTERDAYFRNNKVQGYVHDMGAAMLGGVSGHAGLFSNAHDLAALMQMVLQNGQYAGRNYVESHTVKTFTQRFHKSTRRGIGFDMKELDGSDNMAPESSDMTFGHLGFTGTCTWVDPKHNLVFVFLSNRTYPTMSNNKMHSMNYRPKVQSVLYKALATYPASN